MNIKLEVQIKGLQESRIEQKMAGLNQMVQTMVFCTMSLYDTTSPLI